MNSLLIQEKDREILKLKVLVIKIVLLIKNKK